MPPKWLPEGTKIDAKIYLFSESKFGANLVAILDARDQNGPLALGAVSAEQTPTPDPLSTYYGSKRLDPGGVGGFFGQPVRAKVVTHHFS